MNESADKAKLRIVEVTRAMYESGEAFAGWGGNPEFGRIGGSFGELLRTSPVRAQDPADPLLLTALLDDTPVGFVCTFNGLLHADGNDIDTLWCSGLQVLPEHRNTGAGLMLLLRLRAKNLASGAVGISQIALPIYRQLGWQDITADRYLLVKRSAPILRRWLAGKWLLGAAALIADLGLLVHRSLVRLALGIRSAGYRVEAVDELPAELDSQLRDADGGLRTHRSVDWVNWAMRSGPQRNRRQLYLVKAADDRPVGYFMTGLLHHEEADGGRIRDITLASLRDWMSFGNSDLDETGVLLLGLQTLLGAKADAIELCVPEQDSGRSLRRLGLLQKGALHMVMRFPPNTPGLPDGELSGDNFRFRPADGDGFVN